MNTQMFEEPILPKPEMGKKLTKLNIDIIFHGIKSHNQNIECYHFYTFLQLMIQTSSPKLVWITVLSNQPYMYIYLDIDVLL